jgi:rod shape-determining protein MreD
VRRFLLSFVLLLVALMLQLTVLDRLLLPGGVTPDLVLLVVVALALSSGPMTGTITGFAAGLALDIAPPASHLIGVYALVLCLVGYFCGRVAADLQSTVLLPLAASAVGAAGGAALYAGLGILLGDPDVTGQAVRHVLPETVLYDVLLSPFVLYAVALANRLAGQLGRVAGTDPLAAGGSRSGSRGGARSGQAAIPRDAWIGSGWLAASAELARSRPVPQLHFGSGRTGSGALPGRAAGPQRVTGSKNLARLRFSSGHRGDGVVGSRLLGAGFLTGLAGTGLSMPRSSGGRRLFSRRSRPGTTSARFSSRPAGVRGPAGAGLGAGSPRRGAFSTNAKRKATASAATPRRGTFHAPPQRKRMPATGSPRRGSFSGGSSTRGTFGAGAPRRGAFGGPRRLKALRRATRRSGFPARRSALGRVRGGRSGGWRSSATWRARYKRNGG